MGEGMPIEVTCQCGRKFRAKDSDAGKRAKCPTCGAYFRVPARAIKPDASASIYGDIKPKYCLTLISAPGQKKHQYFRLRHSRNTTIGKASDNVVPLACQKVSRHHCQVSWTDQGWLLEDLKSTNGTYVNGQRIESRVVLTGSEKITLGDCELIFDVPASESVPQDTFDEQLEALRSGDQNAGHAAVEVLAGFGSHAAEQLVPKLSGFDTISGQLAIEVLQKVGSDALPALVNALKHKDKRARGSAARALGKLGAKAASAVPDLLEALDDQDPTVYAEVTWALGQIGAAAVPGLLNALRSEKRDRRIAAAWTLGHIGPPAADALDGLKELTKDQDQEISRVALSALKRINA